MHVLPRAGGSTGKSDTLAKVTEHGLDLLVRIYDVVVLYDLVAVVAALPVTPADVLP